MNGQLLFSATLALIYCSSLLHRASCQTSLFSQDQQELLNAHNHFRGIVDPPASNMEKMLWSEELETVAQNYAEQCLFQHNSERTNQQSTFYLVGENLAITSSPVTNYTYLVRKWFDEREDFDYLSNSCASGAMCGHYTQLVWATTNYVGCGAYRCPQTTGFPYPNSLNLVCNYGPGGNYIGYLPYASGPPCSECYQGLNLCVENLCSFEDTPSYDNTTLAMTEINDASSANEFKFAGGICIVALILVSEFLIL